MPFDHERLVTPRGRKDAVRDQASAAGELENVYRQPNGGCRAAGP